MDENDADVNAFLIETTDLDPFKCYVCQTSKDDGEPLTRCLSATAYLKMQEFGPLTRVYSGIAHELDETEVNVLFQSTAQGKAERKRLAEGCCIICFIKPVSSDVVRLARTIGGRLPGR